MYDDINIEKLRNDLINYFGTAAASGMMMAYTYVDMVKNASDSKLISIAKENGFDLSNYHNGYSKRYYM